MQRHSMTPAQIDLVRKSFDALWPFRRKLTEQFYGRFFELAPDTRRLFPSDMERQQLKLMDTIAAIVGTLDQRELFQSIISHTGRKHADFGVQTSHFTAFGEALIWGLQQQFGPAFTPEMQQAWIELYDAIQAEMMRAAKSKSEDSRTDVAKNATPAKNLNELIVWLKGNPGKASQGTAGVGSPAHVSGAYWDQQRTAGAAHKSSNDIN
jgi:hemoglobin-like flavoprotein